MSIEWILGILIAAQSGLLALYIKHILDCNARDRQRNEQNAEINSKLAVIISTLSNVTMEIGSHDSGIISQLHRYSKAIVKLNAKAGIGDDPR